MKASPIFSKQDAELAMRYWKLDRCGYAYCRKYANGRRIGTYAHHLVLIRAGIGKPDYSKGFVTDHINRNKLDNRRENLRVVTVRENNLNRTIRSKAA